MPLPMSSLTAAVLLTTPLRLASASAAPAPPAAAVPRTTCSCPPPRKEAELKYRPSAGPQTSAAAAAPAEHDAVSNNRKRRSELTRLRQRPAVAAIRGGSAGLAAGTALGNASAASAGPGRGRSRHMRTRMGQTSLAEQWDRITASTSSRNYDDELERKLLGIDELISTQLQSASDEIESKKVPTINPLSQNKWILVASGAVLATSAVALAVYLCGGLAAASSTTTVVAAAGSCSPSDPSAPTQAASTAASAASAAIERFNWLLRGGEARLSRGLSSSSLGLLSSLRPSSYLTSQHPIRQVSTYVTQRVVPSALATLKKMAVMEIWRRIWIVVFHQVAHGSKALTRGASRRFGKVYQRYTPKWIRLGVKGIFKSSVQKAVHGAVGVWVGTAVGGARDVLLTNSVFSAREAVEEAAREVMVEDALAESFAETVPDLVAESIAEGVLDGAADAATEEVCGGVAEALSSAAAAVSTQ